MANVDHVAVAALCAGKDHDAIADCADRRAHRRCVVGSSVIAPLAEEQMLAQAENAANATERDGRTKKRRAKRHSARVVVLAGGGAWRIEKDRFERVVAVGERETSAENLVDDDRAVRLLKTLNQEGELVTLPEVAAHVDFVFEYVGERPGELVAGRGREDADGALLQA